MTMHKDSTQAKVAQRAVGDVRWVETTAEKYATVQREWNMPKSRRNAQTREIVLACSVWQAVHVGKLQAPAVLVRVERIK